MAYFGPSDSTQSSERFREYSTAEGQITCLNCDGGFLGNKGATGNIFMCFLSPKAFVANLSFWTCISVVLVSAAGARCRRTCRQVFNEIRPTKQTHISDAAYFSGSVWECKHSFLLHLGVKVGRNSGLCLSWNHNFYIRYFWVTQDCNFLCLWKKCVLWKKYRHLLVFSNESFWLFQMIIFNISLYKWLEKKYIIKLTFRKAATIHILETGMFCVWQTHCDHIHD